MAVRAQDDPQYRMEIGAGVGVMTYEGDFNGNVLGDMQPAGFLVGRYNFDPYKDLKLSVGFGKIKGSSANVDTFYPDYAENPYTFNSTLLAPFCCPATIAIHNDSDVLRNPVHI